MVLFEFVLQHTFIIQLLLLAWGRARAPNRCGARTKKVLRVNELASVGVAEIDENLVHVKGACHAHKVHELVRAVHADARTKQKRIDLGEVALQHQLAHPYDAQLIRRRAKDMIVVELAAVCMQVVFRLEGALVVLASHTTPRLQEAGATGHDVGNHTLRTDLGVRGVDVVGGTELSILPIFRISGDKGEAMFLEVLLQVFETLVVMKAVRAVLEVIVHKANGFLRSGGDVFVVVTAAGFTWTINGMHIRIHDGKKNTRAHKKNHRGQMKK